MILLDIIQSNMFDNKDYSAPLANKVRPRSLDEFVGQSHILAKGKVLRILIEEDNVASMILWGPPGVGKTTLAMIIAACTKANFIPFSAVTSGIKEIKEVMQKAENNFFRGIRTVLFIDEIHRFNKSQQDAFLPYVEKGNIILIGATTENPSFEVNSALLSRVKVFVLEPLSSLDIVNLLRNAIEDTRGLKHKHIEVSDDLLDLIAIYSNGDARVALNTLEIASSISNIITKEIIEGSMQKKSLLYDKNGEEHYNLISALHKSMRNSDSDASIYYLARMLEAGEDPLFIARRLIRFSSEDIGLADPNALPLAVAAFTAVHYIGMPECNVNLAEAVVYLSLAPKSNSLYTGYNEAKKDALSTISEGVPLKLRNAPTKLMKDIGYGIGYAYAHDYEDKVAAMECLPDNLKDRVYYNPTKEGFEKEMSDRKKTIKEKKYKPL